MQFSVDPNETIYFIIIIVLGPVIFNIGYQIGCLIYEKYNRYIQNKYSIVYFKKLHPDAKKPTRANNGDVGYDLYCLNDNKVYCNGKSYKIKTGIAIQPPLHHFPKILDKSGLATKYGISCRAGVIDNGYRGDCTVVLSCHGGDRELEKDENGEYYEFKKGDKVAQLVFIPYYTPRFIEKNDLNESQRGSNGFGSTGRN